MPHRFFGDASGELPAVVSYSESTELALGEFRPDGCRIPIRRT